MKTTNEHNRKVIANRVLAMTCLSAILGMAGCQQDGSSEQAGQRMSSTAKNADKSIEKSNKTANKQLEGLKDSLDKKSEQAKENIEQSTEASKEILKESEDKVEQITENADKKLDDIKDSSTEKSETTGEYIDDSIITTKVKAAILGSSWLSASHIDVTTNKGIVVLSGTVDSEQNIAKAVEIARSQENVKAVETNLTVSVNATGNK